MPVEASCMCARFGDGAAVVDFAVSGDVEMVSDVGEASLEVALVELVDGEGDIAARGAAMDH